MNKLKKKIIPLLGMFLILALMPADVAAHTADDPLIIELIAGGGNEASAVDVGEVQVWNDGDYLYVKYVIDTDLTPDDPSDDGVPTFIYETHLQIFTDDVEFTDVPHKNGNPIPGHFDYNIEHDPGVSEYTYQIPLDWNVDDEIFIASHAVVQKLGGLEGLELALPDQVTMTVTYPGEASYFDVIITGDSLTGEYEGWCVDTDHVISPGSYYTADVYSSYETIPDGILEYPENLDLVNWIINQDYVGQDSPSGYGTYTYGDVQRSIWALIEDAQSTSGLGSWSQFRVDEILADATAYGEGFEPVCGDVVAAILVPVDGSQVVIAQVTLIEVEVPCYTIDETAWGAGFDFPGKNWATYFTYTIQDYIFPIIFAPVSGQQVITAQTLVSVWANIEITGTVHIMVAYPYAGGPAYFPNLYVSTDGDTTNGWEYVLEGYCVDTEHVIYQNTWYEVNVYEYGDDLTGVVDRPENIDYVQHILDQDWVGKTSENGYGTYTYGDVQRAIWEVIDDGQSTSGLDSWNQNRVNEILADAGWFGP